MRDSLDWFIQRKLYLNCLSLFFVSCLAIGTDKNITDVFHDYTRPLDYWLCIVTFLGDGRVLIPGCLLLWAAMTLSRHPHARVPLLGVVGILVSGALTQFLKMMIGRPRPYASADSRYVELPLDMLHGFTLNKDFASFPSGHATAVFALSWFLFRSMKGTPARIAVISVAAVVALTRVALWKHYLADTVAGATIGIFMSELIIETSELSKTTQQPSA